MTRCVGIDPSLSGCAAYRDDGAHFEIGHEAIGKDVHSRRLRIELIVQPLVMWLVPYKPEVIVVEDYYGQRNQTGLRLIELGWALRSEISWCFPDAQVFECVPSSMKKLVSGSGSSNKVALATHLAAKHGIAFPTDNAADAYGLLQVAKMLAGTLPVPEGKGMHDSLDKIRKAAG